MITLVNYGLGNIQAFTNIYKRLNIPFRVASVPEELVNAKKIILPGVGSFDWAMQCLNDSCMRPVLDDLVLTKKRPVLGVCVGMQMMALRSDEGSLPGLGWFDAEVKRFAENRSSGKTYLPHMGWNSVISNSDSLFKDIDLPIFYFLHSYYFVPNVHSETIGTTNYHGLFSSAVRKDNIYGVQYHPEKSHQWGVQLLKNFAEL